MPLAHKESVKTVELTGLLGPCFPYFLMNTVRFIYWQDGDMWLGYLEEYPDYMTQGENLDDLKDHLLDLQRELASGQIPNVRRVGELKIA